MYLQRSRKLGFLDLEHSQYLFKAPFYGDVQSALNQESILLCKLLAQITMCQYHTWYSGANCGGGAHTVEQFVVDLAKNVQNSSHHPATGTGEVS